ncbi:MAG: GNAT family N-acetyltransferase [Smithella sp.]
MKKTADYDIKVIKSLQEIEDIRSFWEARQCYPDADIDFYIAFCRANKSNVRPHITVLMKHDRPEAMMIGRVDDTDFKFRFGYKVLFSTKVHSLNILYGGTIGKLTESAYDALFEGIMDSLSKGEADIVFFNHLILDSAMYHLASTRPHYLLRDHAININQHWKALLPESWDEFQKTRPKNFRNNLRKYNKRLNDQYGSNRIIKTYRALSEHETLLKDIESIASKTYHRGMGAGFLNNQATRDRTLLALQQERFRAYIMYIDSQPCAFLTGVRYGHTFFPWATGYEPSFNQYSPGTLIIMEMFKALYTEGGIQAVDFGFGEAFYKHNFCNENWQEAPVFIYAPSLKGFLINAIKTLLDTISNFMEYALKKLNVTDKVKKLWRRKLAGRNNEADSARTP